ncbi:sigma-70 family RNA polymerase sigma factor [Mesorhizobium sp.]|uniref:RNA polymerase sigma factor n=1 Tax=Mesorhizobium sp. TaxID=1871066 RepID=UPI000FE980A5|nr:sigma-70 family RNA polymerase sigma factor [Mesorhizobium sp.]RWH31632.1 MAG: sigma-70 family RNA polymerase sigma factor [Mesorhizobium sp.]
MSDAVTLDEAILQPELFRIACRFTHNAEKARDLVNDTIVRALANRDKFDGGNAMGWLSTIMRNYYVAQRRLLRSTREIYTDELVDTRAVAATQEIAVDIKRALDIIDTLPDKLRGILLSLIDETPQEEIADALGVPVGTIKSRLFRARAALLQEMGAGL